MRNPYLKMMGNVKNAARNKGSARNTIGEGMKREIAMGPNGPYRLKKYHPVEITWEDIKEQFESQDGKCHWTGMPIDLDLIFETHNCASPSVDRLDDTKGYVKGNFVITTRFVNNGRGTTSEEKFKLFIKNMKKTLTHMAV